MIDRIGNIIRAEIKKMWMNPLFRLGFVILLIANLLILALSYRNGSNFHTSYQKFKKDYKTFGRTEEERLSYSKELCIKRQVMRLYQAECEADVEGELEFAYSWEFAKMYGYSETWYEAVKKEYESGIQVKYGRSLEEEAENLLGILDEIKPLVEYHDFLADIQTQIKNQQEIKLFQENQSRYSKANLVKTSQDYKRMETVKPCFSGTLGLGSILGAGKLDICPVIALAFFCTLLFLEEKQKGISRLYRATWNGRGGIFIAKTVVTLILCIFIVLVYWGGSFIYIWRAYGNMAMEAPVQTIPGFGKCTMSLSIGTYLVYYLMQKILGMFVLGSILQLVALIVENIVTYFLVIGIGSAFSYFCAYMIPQYTLFSALRYLNFVSYLSAAPVVRDYYNANVFGRPVGKGILCNVIGILLAVAVLYMGFRRNGKAEKVYRSHVTVFWNIHKKQHRKSNVSVFRHELFKLFWGANVMVLLLISGILLCTYTVKEPVYLCEEEYYYQLYMKRLEGKPDEKKQEYIQNETLRIQKVERKIEDADQAYWEGKISKLERDELIGYWELQIKGRAAFGRILGRWEYVNQHKNKQYAMVYEDGWNCVFGLGDIEGERDRVHALLCVVILIICLGGIQASEYETGMKRLQSATLRGGRHITACKMLACATVLLFTMLIVYGQDILFAKENYGIDSVLEKAGSIPQLSGCMGAGGSILSYCIALFLIRFLGYSVLLIVNLFISRYTKNTIKTMLFLFFIFALPIVLDGFGVTVVNRISMNCILYGNHALQWMGKWF